MRHLVVCLALVLWAWPAGAQTMRPFTTFRQMHGETRLHSRIEYAAGNLQVGPGRETDLYRMDLSYDAERYLPLSDFNAANGSVTLGLRAAGDAGVRVSSRNQLQQLATITLSPRVDLTLDLNLGAADANLELGGLRLSSLHLKTGASKTLVDFSEPNSTRCRRAAFSTGAAELTVMGLGNSRCDEIELEGGVGSVKLDFTGAWTSSSRVQITMAMGELTLRLPRRVGVKVRMDRFLSGFEPSGLIRQGEAFVSGNYERAARRLDLDITSAVGNVDIEWAEEVSREK